LFLYKKNGGTIYNESDNLHFIISLLLLLPASLYIEVSDGVFSYDSVGYFILSEWFGGIVASLVLALLIWVVLYLIKKRMPFIRVLYKCCYFVAFFSVSGFAIGCLVGKILA